MKAIQIKAVLSKDKDHFESKDNNSTQNNEWYAKNNLF